MNSIFDLDLSSIRESNKELVHLDKLANKGIEAIELVSNLHSIIEKYGVSQPLMEAADHKCELVQLQCFPSYESLGFTLTKDTVALESLDKVKEILSNLWEKFLDILRKIGETIKRWVSAIINFFKPAKIAVKEMKEKVARHNLNSQEAANGSFRIPDDVIVKSLHASDFDKTHKLTVNILNTFSNDPNLKEPLAIHGEAFDHRSKHLVQTIFKVSTNELKEVLGIGLSVDSNNRWSIQHYSEGASIETDKFANLGWTSNLVEDALGKAEDAITISEKTDNQMSLLVKRYDELMKYIKDELRTVSKKNEDQLQESHSAIVRLRTILSFIQTLIQRSLKGIQKLTVSSLSLGKAVLMSSRQRFA